MNNRVQQRFDRSIREAVAEAARLRDEAREVPDRSRVRELLARAEAADERASRARRRAGWKLQLCPETGATIYGPPRSTENES